MRVPLVIGLACAALGLALFVASGVMTGEPPSREKAVAVERELAVRFDAGRKWAVVIGVNEYIDPKIPALRYCVSDAHLVADTLAKKCGYEGERILLISDDQPKAHLRPTRMVLLEKIPSWLEQATAGDTVLVYFSGHGFLDASGQSYLAPQDCKKANLGLWGFRTDELRNMLDQCKATQKVLILDCCHAGGVKAGEAPGPSAQQVAAAFQQAQGLITLASCAKEELSREWDAQQQGLFTYFLTQGLQGAADRDGDGLVNSDELYLYTVDKVSTTGKRELNAQQTPVRFIPPSVKGVFALARVEGRLGPVEKRRFVKATFTVREQDENGPPAPGVTVELLYGTKQDAEGIVLGRVTTDAQGAASMDIWLTPAQQSQGTFLVLVTTSGGTKTDPLPGFPKSADWNLYVPSHRPAPPLQLPGTSPREVTNSIGMKMTLIPAGEFMMGSPDSDTDAGADERPQHPVKITKPFYLGVYEVTQAEYEKVMGTNPSTFKDAGGRAPVEGVLWENAQEFCKKLSALPDEQKAGWRYRLPTEAEWEYACRAGSTSRYCFGDDGSGLGEYGWYTDNSGSKTHPVGEKKPNALGLYDMHGNVWEWCQDRYEKYYAGSPAADPPGPAGGSYRVFRGGSWNFPALICRSAYRYISQPGLRDFDLGFRVSRVAAE